MCVESGIHQLLGWQARKPTGFFFSVSHLWIIGGCHHAPLFYFICTRVFLCTQQALYPLSCLPSPSLQFSTLLLYLSTGGLTVFEKDKLFRSVTANFVCLVDDSQYAKQITRVTYYIFKTVLWNHHCEYPSHQGKCTLVL